MMEIVSIALFIFNLTTDSKIPIPTKKTPVAHTLIALTLFKSNVDISIEKYIPKIKTSQRVSNRLLTSMLQSPRTFSPFISKKQLMPQCVNGMYTIASNLFA